MISLLHVLTLGQVLVAAAVIPASTTPLLPVVNITRFANIKFENLAVRADGQILTTVTYPNASIYQVDPLGILPPTLIHRIPNVTSATGIVEGEPGIFYVASGTESLNISAPPVPQSYSITQLDLRGVFVRPNGTLSKEPKSRRVVNLPGAALPNGIAFARPGSDHLLVADSFRGLIWNANVCTGEVSVALNDTTTKGSTTSGLFAVGANGIKVHNGVMYWTSTGASKVYKVGITKDGKVRKSETPTLVASNVPCDDLLVDPEGNIYVAGPQDVVTKVYPSGKTEIVIGTPNSNSSSLIGPTALRFGRLASDRWSLYITTNGGAQYNVPGTAGVSRVDLK